MGTMSQTRLRSWWVVGIWTVAGIGFGVVFFAWGGPAEFGNDKVRVLAGAIPIAFGYGGYLLAMVATRARGGAVATDERDTQVQARATMATLIAVLVGVFTLSMGLWEAFREAGAVPVGWMWFLAYGTVIATFLMHAVATLVVDARFGGHA